MRTIRAAVVVSWVLAVVAGPVAAQSPDTTGAEIFHTICAACHGPDGRGNTGPDLHAVISVRQIATIVRGGHGRMPPFKGRFSEQQIQEVARYVYESFGKLGDLQRGGALFRLNCAPCHSAGIRGGGLVFTDRNAPDLSTKEAAAIPAAIRTGPGPMPRWDAEALSDDDVASITLYVLYMQNPAHPGGFGLSYLGPVTEGLIAIVLGLGLLVAASLWLERGRRG